MTLRIVRFAVVVAIAVLVQGCSSCWQVPMKCQKAPAPSPKDTTVR